MNIRGIALLGRAVTFFLITGAPVSADTGQGTCLGADAIRINEFLANPDGTDSSALLEWVELYNNSSQSVDLTGWVLERGKSSYGEVATLSGSIAHNGTFVIAEQNHPGLADYMLPEGDKLDLGNAGSNADAIRLLDCDGVVADTVLYGTNNADSWLDDGGLVAGDAALAPKPGEGDVTARVFDGADTNDSFADFCTDADSTPNAANSCGSTTDTGDTGTGEFVACDTELRINEFAPNPDGSDTGNEWVELYNGDSLSTDLTGWSLEWGTSSWQSDAFLDGGVVGPGGWIVVGGSDVLGVDLVVTISMGNASNSDGVRLVCPDGSIADTVIYGSPNEDGWVDDHGTLAESMADSAGSGECITRIQDGYDTDQSGVDFQLLSPEECTPGGENPFTVPAVCELVDSVVINEFMPDPEGTDSGNEWVELINTGADSVRLDGWSIEVGKSSWGDFQYTFPSGSELTGNGIVLVGGEEVFEIDFLADDLNLGNAGSNGDGLRLVDCEGGVVDTVIYGLDNDDALVDDSGGIAISIAPLPESNQSVARYPDGADTDMSGDDFAVCFAPTPGVENGECSGGDVNVPGGGGEIPGGCGCGDDGLSSEDSVRDSGCATASPMGGYEWLLMIALVWRRRRKVA